MIHLLNVSKCVIGKLKCRKDRKLTWCIAHLGLVKVGHLSYELHQCSCEAPSE